MNHTKEPWAVGDTNYSIWENQYQAIDKTRRVIFTCNAVKPEYHEQAKIDARRIVACVNACEGIKTETLERYVSGIVNYGVGQTKLEMLVEKDNEIDTLCARVAELEGELKAIMAIIQSDLRCETKITFVSNIASTALKGGE